MLTTKKTAIVLEFNPTREIETGRKARVPMRRKETLESLDDMDAIAERAAKKIYGGKGVYTKPDPDPDYARNGCFMAFREIPNDGPVESWQRIFLGALVVWCESA